MATFRHRVFISRPVEAVFRAVADVHDHAQWQEGLLRTEVDGDQRRAGARGVEVRRLFGRTAEFPYEITVYERNKPDDTFGWGVVLSAETLENLTRNDPVSATWIKRYFAYWDDIAVIHKDVRTVSTADNGQWAAACPPPPRSGRGGPLL